MLRSAVLYGAAILWGFGLLDTIYAHQDREDDALLGRRVNRAAVRRADRAPFLGFCYAGAVGLLALCGWLAGLSIWFYPGLLVPAGLLARQVIVLDIDDPMLCLRLFRANREVGLAVGLLAAILLAGGCERSPPHSCAPIPLFRTRTWCRKLRCIWPPRSPPSGARPRTGSPRATSIRRTGRLPGRAGRRWRGTSWIDHPASVAGRRVLDFAAGGGIAAIAAARAGAAVVEAAEIDALAVAAIALNADANGVTVVTESADVVWCGVSVGCDSVRRCLLRGADDGPHSAVVAGDGWGGRGVVGRSGTRLPPAVGRAY